jgi:hypothetical protein
MMLIKNRERHSLPPERNLVPRFDNKIRAILSNMLGVTRGRYIRLDFSTSKNQIRQKIHGAFTAASTSFMRERAMNVYMKN